MEGACERGSAEACSLLAMSGGAQRNRYFARACELGDASGCRGLTSDDPVEAEAVKRRAELLDECKSRDAGPCAVPSIAELVPVTRSRLSAAARESCRTEGAARCTELARAQARYPNPDLSLVAELHRAACDGHQSGSCIALERIYADGQGVPKQPGRALELHDLVSGAAGTVHDFGRHGGRDRLLLPSDRS